MKLLSSHLASLTTARRTRSLRSLASRQGRLIQLDGRSLLNFSSNDYLGLASHPKLIEAAHQALNTYGYGAGAARLLVGNFEQSAELEHELADWLGAESALLFSSGYHANLALLPSLAEKDDRILSDEANHASIIDGCRLSKASREIYPHLSPPISSLGPNDWLVSESLFSMDGDTADLNHFAAKAAEVGARLIVDDAHAIGVHGTHGTGLGPTSAFARMGTLGKAMGSYGAFIVGSEELIAVLRSVARSFIFTTGLPAPVIAASLVSVRIARSAEGEELRLRLHSSCQKVRNALQVENHGPIFSIELGDEENAVRTSAALEKHGLLVQPIRPPTVSPGRCRLRLVISASHQDTDISHLLAALSELNLIR